MAYMKDTTLCESDGWTAEEVITGDSVCLLIRFPGGQTAEMFESVSPRADDFLSGRQEFLAICPGPIRKASIDYLTAANIMRL